MRFAIRTLMFTFEDLLTVPQPSIRELVGAADKKMLAMALKGGKENVKAHLLKAMSSRAAEMMKEDMEAMGPVRGTGRERRATGVACAGEQAGGRGQDDAAHGGGR